MQLSGSTLLLLIIALVAILFIMSSCTLKCSPKRESFKYGITQKEARAAEQLVKAFKPATKDSQPLLGRGLSNTGVDDGFGGSVGHNRHYCADTSTFHAPLNACEGEGERCCKGGVDFSSDLRRLERGELFQQYTPAWKGSGKVVQLLKNYSKNRFDLANMGELTALGNLRDEVEHDLMALARIGK